MVTPVSLDWKTQYLINAMKNLGGVKRPLTNKALARTNKSNSRLSKQELNTVAPLDKTCQLFLQQALEKLNLSTRAYHKTIKVARTIADLANKEHILPEHLQEALSYRMQC